MSSAVGKRIRFFRKLRWITKMELGKAVGFSSRTARIRIAQYESGVKTPKPEMLKKIAKALNISEYALLTPDFENAAELMHTLFALEDTDFFSVFSVSSNIDLYSSTEDESIPLSVRIMLKTWVELHDKCMCGKISKEEYDQWRYNFPNIPQKVEEESEFI